MIKTAVVGCQPYNGRPVLQRGARSWIREDLLPCIYRPGGWAEIEAHAGRLVASIIQTQERLGLDILTEGESTRRDYWSPFVIGLDGVVVDDSGVVTVVAPLAPRSEAVLNEWQLAQSFTQQPVKITLPGPTTCACYVTDSTYGSHEKLSEAFAIVINHYVRRLADLGCRYIQLDDCRLAYYPDIAARYGIGHLGKAFEGVSSLTTRVVHICRGTPGFTKEYHESTLKAPEQDCYASILSMLDDIPVDLISIEHAFCPSPLSVFARIRNKTVMLGVVDVATQDVEPVELIIARAAPVINMLGSERVILAPDCGFSAWSHPVASQREALYHKALAKLENMVEAARRLNAG